MSDRNMEIVGKLVQLILSHRYARPHLVRTNEFKAVVTMLEPRLMEVVNIYAERDGERAERAKAKARRQRAIKRGATA